MSFTLVARQPGCTPENTSTLGHPLLPRGGVPISPLIAPYILGCCGPPRGAIGPVWGNNGLMAPLCTFLRKIPRHARTARPLTWAGKTLPGTASNAGTGGCCGSAAASHLLGAACGEVIPHVWSHMIWVMQVPYIGDFRCAIVPRGSRPETPSCQGVRGLSQSLWYQGGPAPICSVAKCTPAAHPRGVRIALEH